MKAQLTKHEQRALDAYNRLLDRHGYPPSIRELCDEYGCRSSSTLHAQLSKLRALGFTIYTRGQAKQVKHRAGVFGVTREPVPVGVTEWISDVEEWLRHAYRSVSLGRRLGFDDLNRLSAILNSQSEAVAS